MAMIGDRLYTDIALGQASGIATVLVLSGETKPEDLKDSPFKPDYTFQNLAGVADWLEQHSGSAATVASAGLVAGLGTAAAAIAALRASRGLDASDPGVDRRAGSAPPYPTGAPSHEQSRGAQQDDAADT